MYLVRPVVTCCSMKLPGSSGRGGSARSLEGEGPLTRHEADPGELLDLRELPALLPAACGHPAREGAGRQGDGPGRCATRGDPGANGLVNGAGRHT